MKSFSKNPWLVEDLSAFNFWCCPECFYQSQDTGLFMNHAIDSHPDSLNLFTKLKMLKSDQISNEVEKTVIEENNKQIK